MKSGFCSKCGSNEVKIYQRIRKDIDVSSREDRLLLYVEDYICVDCGFTEQYYSESSLILMRNREAQKERGKNKPKNENK